MMFPSLSVDRYLEKNADRIIWVLIGIYVALFTYLSFLKFFSFAYYDWDFASEHIILWNTLHGRWLYYPFLEQNIFGAHLFVVIWLLLPIYALCQHPLTLLFLQSLFFGLAAYPLYLFAKLSLGRVFALLVCLAYLLYPSIGFVNLFETHFEIYEIFFLFFALYFFERQHLRNFIIFLLLTLCCKENTSLVVFMFGFYGCLRRRPWPWILTPLCVGAAWFWLAVKIIIPHFAKDATSYQEGFIFSIYYKHLGSNIGEMLKNILLHSVRIGQYALASEKKLYLFKLFSPVGFLVFLSPGAMLMAVPILMQNLLSSAWTHAQIHYQYVCLLIPFIFSSTVFALRRLLGRGGMSSRRWPIIVFLLVAVVVSGLFLKAPQLYFLRYRKDFLADGWDRQKDKLVRLISERAPVMATFQFLPRLSSRSDLSSLHLVSSGYRMYTDVKYVPPANLEYLLIDFDEPLLLGSFFPEDAPANIRAFLEADAWRWRVLTGVGDIVLFKKDYGEGVKLQELNNDPSIEHKRQINLAHRLEFLGYNIIKDVSALGPEVLHLLTYWRRIGDIEAPLGLYMHFQARDGIAPWDSLHTIGYRVYEPKTWPLGQIIQEHLYIFMPSEIPQNMYAMRAGVFSMEDGKMLEVIPHDSIDAFGWMMGEFSVPQAKIE